MIRFEVQHNAGDRKVIEVPEEINLNLMEVLRASDYPIAATCGGMALCATCQVEVLKGGEQLSEPGSAELDMLDTLPDATADSRLACQIKINGQLQDAVLRLKSSES
jgi:ferredoxin